MSTAKKPVQQEDGAWEVFKIVSSAVVILGLVALLGWAIAHPMMVLHKVGHEAAGNRQLIEALAKRAGYTVHENYAGEPYLRLEGDWLFFNDPCE